MCNNMEARDIRTRGVELFPQLAHGSPTHPHLDDFQLLERLVRFVGDVFPHLWNGASDTLAKTAPTTGRN